ncbi:NAD(P)/FAD-dependent oxidoreductase [Microbacterium sp. 1P10UB]|uniref:NAD(P)/FAD-dependent oxidoreductase n=1 Tax=unclassified Microbacterium TaxID=2609290 RepID=UPI0039A24493
MRNSSPVPAPLDVVVIGAGPAGLQAALTLGRMRYDTVVLDSGRYRNETVQHAHNLITNDGRPPAELRAAARAELAGYDTVEVRDVSATAVTRTDEGFTVTDEDGRMLHTRRVVLATGMRDDLPDIPGLAEAWGREVAQCPFCHGYELRARPVAVLGVPPHAAFQQAMLARIASEVTVIAPDELVRAERIDGGLALHLTDGGRREVAGLFLGAAARQSAPFAQDLGCRILPSSGVEVDENGRTTVPGVYAAGDLAHLASAPGPLVSLAAAIAAGQLAAVGVVRDALEHDLTA